MAKSKRFTVKSENTGFSAGVSVITDRATGVQYLYYKSGYGGGMTVLVDKEGKPITADSGK
jgi:hypothetical protein